MLVDLKFDNKKLLLIGEGLEFEFKLEKLLMEAKGFFVLTKDLNDRIIKLKEEGKIKLIEFKGEEDSFEYIKKIRPDIIVLATENFEFAKKVKQLASDLGILVNVVDAPELCDFHFVANSKIGEIEVGIATKGKSPALASIIRRRIERAITQEDINRLELLSYIRKKVKTVKEKEKRREAIYRILRDDKVNHLIKEGKIELALLRAEEIISNLYLENPKGKVYLVGAGPGKSDLITLAGLKILKKADVVIFDRLVSRALLRFAERAEKIYAGKNPGESNLQDNINKIMLEESLKGKTVIRLKNGDPFIFGRGAEEFDYLKTYGIDVEVIPGVSSVTGVPTFANLAITKRGIASSFAAVSMVKAGGETFDLKGLAKNVDTLVILMGLNKAREIEEQLKDVGFEDKPVAIISKGTTKGQKVVFTKVRELTQAIVEYNVRAPALIVIGDIANHRN
ncbi:MAG: uroporphyrinogen-III C-methyltransferase [Nitrososphaerales archaeon]